LVDQVMTTGQRPMRLAEDADSIADDIRTVPGRPPRKIMRTIVVCFQDSNCHLKCPTTRSARECRGDERNRKTLEGFEVMLAL
jgi:hypothetical protein